MVGKENMERYRIVNHYCQKASELREVSRIGGASIEINTHYLDADLKTLTGLIEPHFYAGFPCDRMVFIGSAVKPMPLGLGYKAETIQAQPFRVGL